MKGITFMGGALAGLIFLFPLLSSSKLFYAAVNAKSFFVFWLFIFSTAAFACLAFSGKLPVPRLNKKTILLTTSISLILLYVIASFVGVFPAQSFFGDMIRGTGTIFIATLFLISYILSSLLEQKDWRLIIKAVSISSVTFSIIYILNLIFGVDEKSALAARNMIGNSTFAGTFVVVGFFATIFSMAEIKAFSRKGWLLIGCAFVQMINPIILNSSIWTGETTLGELVNNPLLIVGDARASSVVIFLTAFYFIVRFMINRFSPQGSKEIIKKVFTGSVCVAILVGLVIFFTSGLDLTNKYSKGSDFSRFMVWGGAVEAIKDKPLLGYGPESFEIVNQHYFDNRVLADKSLKEAWFDRAHNIFLDTAIDIGIIGLLVFLALIFFLGRVFYRAGKAGLLSKNESHVLIALLVANIIQMQTSFQTVVTYFYLFLLVGWGIYLEKNMLDSQSDRQNNINKILALAFIIFLIVFVPKSLFKEKSRQHDLVSVFSISDTAARREKINDILSSKKSLVALRIGSTSLIEGTLTQLGQKSMTKEGIAAVKEELVIYEKAYEEFVTENPSYYRARVNLSYIYMLETILGDYKLDKAETLLAESHVFSPGNPITPSLEALNYTYMGDFEKADMKMKEAFALNPEIPLTQNIANHIEAQKKTFPKITFLGLKNL